MAGRRRLPVPRRVSGHTGRMVRARSCIVVAHPDRDERRAVVAAKPALYDRLTGRDNLRYAAELFGVGRDAPIDESAARFGIGHALDNKVGGYSTGMKSRLALARAILHNPDLLLLDEPTSGL